MRNTTSDHIERKRMDVKIGEKVLSRKPPLKQLYWKVVTRYYSDTIRLASDYSWGCIICDRVYNRQTDAALCCCEEKMKNPQLVKRLHPYLSPSDINTIKGKPRGVVKWVDGEGIIGDPI